MNTAREAGEGVNHMKIAYNPMWKTKVEAVFKLCWKYPPEVFHPADCL